VGALRAATFYAGWSLLPLTFGLGLSAYLVLSLLFGISAGMMAGAVFTAVSLLLLYGWGFLLRPKQRAELPMEEKADGLVNQD